MMNKLSAGIKKVQIADETWLLHYEKAIYWENEQTLIVTDIHLGKSGHFRKSGIAAPTAINKKNLDRLSKLINFFKPSEFLILGDLFHSNINKEWFEFENWRKLFPNLKITLVAGNHDLLHHSFYDSGDIKTTQHLKKGIFTFVHDKSKVPGSNSIVVSGHIHPAINLKAKGRQSIKVPCFLIKKNYVLLPAFGEFTGCHIIKPEETDSVYCVVENDIISLKF